MRALSLFSGIGGLDIGVHAALAARGINITHTRYHEQSAFCAEWLRRAIESEELPPGEVIERDINKENWHATQADIIIGGYPCQPYSKAGVRKGEADARDGWPAFRRAIDEIRPALAIGENVRGHITLGFERVASDLCAMGFKVRCVLASAAEIGAPHARQRLFWLAMDDTDSTGQETSGSGLFSSGQAQQPVNGLCSSKLSSMDDTDSERVQDANDSGRERAQTRWSGSGLRGSDIPARDSPTQVSTDFPPAPSDYHGWAEYLTARPYLAPAIPKSPPEGFSVLLEQAGIEIDPAAQSSLSSLSYGLRAAPSIVRAIGNACVPAQAAHAVSILLEGIRF